MNLLVNSPAPCRIGKRPPAPDWKSGRPSRSRAAEGALFFSFCMFCHFAPALLELAFPARHRRTAAGARIAHAPRCETAGFATQARYFPHDARPSVRCATTPVGCENVVQYRGRNRILFGSFQNDLGPFLNDLNHATLRRSVPMRRKIKRGHVRYVPLRTLGERGDRRRPLAGSGSERKVHTHTHTRRRGT